MTDKEVRGSKLEDALVTLELKLDERFEAAESQSRSQDEAESGLILEQVLDLIYETFDSVIPYDRIGLALVEEDGAVVRSRWARSEDGDVKMGVGYAAPLADDAVQFVLNSGEPRVVDDLAAYAEEHPTSDAAKSIVEEGMLSSLTCPLIVTDKPIGMIVFSSKQKDAYTDEHQNLFGQVASHVSAILERSRLYERLIDLNWQLRVARDALEYQASHDGLTRLWNRGAIMEVAEQEFDRAKRQSKPIAIVMADIDHFKQVNDTHGHGVGDVVLQVVAERLSGALRSYETVGRYGGEEFLITLYDCDAEGATHAMERLRASIASEGIETHKGTLELTISLGAAANSVAEGDLDDMIQVADEALYRAKDAGRNCHEVTLIGEDGP